MYFSQPSFCIFEWCVPDVAQIGFVWLFELIKAANDMKLNIEQNNNEDIKILWSALGIVEILQYFHQ